MRQIPLKALPHTATVRTPADGEFGGVYNDPVTIEHVRLDAAATVRRTDYQIAADTVGILFIDAVNSSPAMGIPTGSIIEIGEEPMTASACHPLLAWSQVHHWEVEVR